MELSVEMTSRLDRLEQQRSLEVLIHGYLESADSRKWSKWIESFTPDGRFDLPNSFGLMIGRDEIYRVCVGKMDGVWSSTQHMIVNPDFEIAGDEARGTANIIFVGLPSGGSPESGYQMGGRYRWFFRREEGQWRIADAWEEFIWNNGSDQQSVFAQDV